MKIKHHYYKSVPQPINNWENMESLQNTTLVSLLQSSEVELHKYVGTNVLIVHFTYLSKKIEFIINMIFLLLIWEFLDAVSQYFIKTGTMSSFMMRHLDGLYHSIQFKAHESKLEPNLNTMRLCTQDKILDTIT